MTRHELHEILKKSFSERKAEGLPIFEWEHCAKSFHYIRNNLAMEHLMNMSKENQKSKEPTILKCVDPTGAYYFGIGLSDCENITLKKLRKLYRDGRWSVYTWAD